MRLSLKYNQNEIEQTKSLGAKNPSASTTVDPLTVFLGHLRSRLIKPDLLERLQGQVGDAPAAVHMKPGEDGQLQCALIAFSTQQSAASLVSWNGPTDPAITPDALRA